jgi:hypothetical protein
VGGRGREGRLVFFDDGRDEPKSSPGKIVARKERPFQLNLNCDVAPIAVKIRNSKSLSHLSRRQKLYPTAASTALMASPLEWTR